MGLCTSICMNTKGHDDNDGEQSKDSYEPGGGLKRTAKEKEEPRYRCSAQRTAVRSQVIQRFHRLSRPRLVSLKPQPANSPPNDSENKVAFPQLRKRGRYLTLADAVQLINRPIPEVPIPPRRRYQTM
ncbi:uncharacterized protein EI90DRAFT_3019667 [Cantharellus anzutake]|uniref:uncharacterized protein n=1 Tax=Cantharellus anzutake TaxID=1750568 RepID=UPI001904675D|nr:uncharacterized protein EI90DRAFT_3019667 [Cantharellus anzutake]KAF8324310.1 hypothetical protein EI90DRAFT_3019667 [Cantharellus anzutake]